MPDPPAPPPLPPTINFGAPPPQIPPPVVPEAGPPGSLLLHLVMYSGGTFNNHWNWYIRSSYDPSIGTIIHTPGDVHNGFRFEIKRYHDFRDEPSMPLHIIPLQWIDGRYLDETAMFNNGCRVDNDRPVCEFERSVHKVKPPGKSLNSVTSVSTSEHGVMQPQYSVLRPRHIGTSQNESYSEELPDLDRGMCRSIGHGWHSACRHRYLPPCYQAVGIYICIFSGGDTFIQFKV